jgi:hypothetical protein
MNRFRIKNAKTTTVLVEVEVLYDAEVYESPRDAADELLDILDLATSDTRDEYLHITNVRPKGLPR